MRRNAKRPAIYPADGQIITLNLWSPRKREFHRDATFGRRVLEQACRAAGAKIVNRAFSGFGEGAGYTGVLVLAQSHCSIHTYPDHDFIAIDVYTCGPLDTSRVVTEVVAAVLPAEYHVQTLPRLATPPSRYPTSIT
jgi:S-adenosylmethionine decarboxylase